MAFSSHPRRDVDPKVPWSTGINEDILITPQGAARPAGDWSHRWRPMR
jgi:hypothetical protein